MRLFQDPHRAQRAPLDRITTRQASYSVDSQPLLLDGNASREFHSEQSYEEYAVRYLSQTRTLLVSADAIDPELIMRQE